jgi:pentatricopeptide repeat protein
MLGAYVCKQCRARLSRRIAPVRAPQWQPRATFLSFRDRARDDAERTPPETQPQDKQADAKEEGQNRPPIRYKAMREPSQPQEPDELVDPQEPGGRYSSSRRGGTHFEESPREERAAPFRWERAGRHLGENHRKEAAASFRRDSGPASAIQAELTSKRADRAWAIFDRTYTSADCEALTDPSESDVVLLENGRIFHELLKGMMDAFCFMKRTPTVTPTMVLLRYEQLGLARREYWAATALSHLTHQAIVAINASSSTYAPRPLPEVLSELLSTWRLFFQLKGTKDMPLDTISTEWNLPAVDALPDMWEHKDFGMRLQQYHPRYQGNAELAFCAAYFYVLSDALFTISSLHKEAEPFIHFLERSLAASFLGPVYTHVYESSRFRSLRDDVQKGIIDEINNAPNKALAAIGSSGATLGQQATTNQAANIEEFCLKRIARAVESKISTTNLSTLWTEMERTFTSESGVAIPRRIYNAFLSGYIILLQAPRSVEVWNHMIAHGIQPDVQSWVALLDGCAKARDLNGFNAMWARMLSTGIEPDNYAWTSRINGLISLGQVKTGLAAFDDMGRRWISAENAIKNPQKPAGNRKGIKKPPPSKSAVNNCTRPSIEVVNGAITALVRLGNKMRHEMRIDFVQKILAWGGGFSIKPNAITYNSLIQLYFRAGNYPTAFKILRQMETEGVEADLATYSMLVTVTFDNGSFDSLSKSQQADKIIGLFDTIEGSGLKLNDVVYGTAINRLLKQHNNSIAVRRVTEYMAKRGTAPSAQIYTFMITHYFQQQPPAIAATDALVEQLFTNQRMSSDRVLFERIIEGYARHGEIGKMMSVLTRMSKRGHYPGWQALTAVLEALVRDGDMARARDIVQDVDRGMGVAKGGIAGDRATEARFFALVRRLGLNAKATGQMMGDSTYAQEYVEPVVGANVVGASWVDPESTGNFTWNDRPVEAGEDEPQLHDQEIQQMAQREEVQEEMEYTEGQPTYQQDSAGAQYEQTPQDVAREHRERNAQYHQAPANAQPEGEHMPAPRDFADVRFEQEPINVQSEYEQAPPIEQYERTPAERQYEQAPAERQPRKAPTPDEEDVHGFLTDEHDDYHSRVNRP